MMREDFNRKNYARELCKCPQSGPFFPLPGWTFSVLHLAGASTKHEEYEHACAGFTAVCALMSVHKATLKT